MTLEHRAPSGSILGGSALAGPGSALATPLPRVLRPQRAVPSDAVRPTRAEVNLANLRHNFRLLQREAGSALVWSVLKADGYGHGAKAVARTLERAGATGLCVALLEEGIELRSAGIRVPILVMGGYYGGAGQAWGELLRHDLTPVLHGPEQITALAEEVRYSGSEPARFHLKVDTGMARLGASPKDLDAIAALIAHHKEVELEGVMTHFACADGGDLASIEAQLDLFEASLTTLARRGLTFRLRHAANSAALLRSERARLDLVRPGIALFGVEPRQGLSSDLKPVMRVRTEVVAVRTLPAGQSVGYGATWTAQRESIIATIPMGYADGLSRLLSNRGAVLVRGKRAPIVGVVSMDMAMLDVTDIPGASVTDECVVLGSQRGPHGENEITAQEVAELRGTIPWEVLTDVSRRVPRFYREP